jgi:fibronectin type 3 domain-containing protein
VPGAPTGVTATAQSSSSILITWDAVPGAGWYVVYRSLSANGTYNLLVGIAATQYTSSPLPANTTYYFKVAASINGNIGPLSSYVSATTLPR